MTNMKKAYLLILLILMIAGMLAAWIIASSYYEKERKRIIEEIHVLAEAQAKEDIKNGTPKYFITGTVPVGYSQNLEEEFRGINLKCTGSACLGSEMETEYGEKYNETIETWYKRNTGSSFESKRKNAFEKQLRSHN